MLADFRIFFTVRLSSKARVIISHRTLNVSLHYLVKYKRSAIAILLMYNSDLLLNIRIFMLLNHNAQNAVLRQEQTFVPLIHCIIDDTLPHAMHARPSSVAASVHRRHELDECRKCFRACIHAKGGHFSI